mmetsp:Transcript_24082/g.67846  ORF Transcript_24082/g.67846 Transcript_24082/m.67846 type:complete len:231 (+) Transcript_24082:453-1145(+)
MRVRLLPSLHGDRFSDSVGAVRHETCGLHLHASQLPSRYVADAPGRHPRRNRGNRSQLFHAIHNFVPTIDGTRLASSDVSDSHGDAEASRSEREDAASPLAPIRRQFGERSFARRVVFGRLFFSRNERPARFLKVRQGALHATNQATKAQAMGHDDRAAGGVPCQARPLHGLQVGGRQIVPVVADHSQELFPPDTIPRHGAAESPTPRARRLAAAGEAGFLLELVDRIVG